MENYICVYSKPPIPGRTKTRMAKTTGNEMAAALSLAMLLDICEQALQIPDAVVSLWHPPGATPKEFGELSLPVEKIRWYQQQGQDLGQRMSHTFETMLRPVAAKRVVIVGSDCITHSPQSISDAFSALDEADVVLQPASDGGYVLVGQSCWQAAMFDDVEWGSETVMETSRQRLRDHSISHRELQITFDIDVEEDLADLEAFLQQNERRHVQQWFQKYRSG